jgi:hypothetical protein
MLPIEKQLRAGVGGAFREKIFFNKTKEYCLASSQTQSFLDFKSRKSKS